MAMLDTSSIDLLHATFPHLINITYIVKRPYSVFTLIGIIISLFGVIVSVLGVIEFRNRHRGGTAEDEENVVPPDTTRIRPVLPHTSNHSTTADTQTSSEDAVVISSSPYPLQRSGQTKLNEHSSPQ